MSMVEFSEATLQRFQPKIFFEGRDILVHANLRPSKVLAITFSSRGEKASRGGHRKEGFGERLLASHGISYVCFINKGNHWWQTEEILFAIEKLRKEIAGYAFERIMTYGASMGAYGALAFSTDLQATDVLAFSPQYSIAGTELPLQAQWREDMRGTPILYEPLGERLSRTARITVGFDSLIALDLAHVRALESVRKVDRLVVPLSGHSTALFLGELGLLKSFVLALINDGQHPRRDAVRSHRRQSIRYWFALAGRLRAKGRVASAASAVREGAQLLLGQEDGDSEERYERISQACRILSEVGRADEGLALAVQYVSRFEGDFRAACVKARMLQECGKGSDAAAELRRAVHLAGAQALPQLELAALYASSGAFMDAEREVQKALEASGGSVADWAGAAAILEHVAPRVAIKAAQRALQGRPNSQKISLMLKRLQQPEERTARKCTLGLEGILDEMAKRAASRRG